MNFDISFGQIYKIDIYIFLEIIRLFVFQDTSNLSYSNRGAIANQAEHQTNEAEDSLCKSKTASISSVTIPATSSSLQSKEDASLSVSKSVCNTHNLASSKVDVENFVPDSGDFDNFLDDENTNSASSNQNAKGNFLDSR